MRFLGNLLLGENHVLRNREMHVHYDDPVNEKSEKRWSEILELIKENPNITRSELAEIAGINPSAIQKHIAKLKAEGLIERVGGDKGGHWKIIK